MNKKMKRKLFCIFLSIILLIIAIFLDIDNPLFNNILLVISYAVVGLEIVSKAFKNIIRGKVFDENFLMTVATIGAFCIGEFPEAVAVMLFYQVGELFQSYAVDKSRKSVSALMDIRPDYANVVRKDNIERLDPEDVEIGEIILIKTGEKVPLDGIIVEGSSSLNTIALTGESIPRTVDINDEILSGCINNEGTLKVRVTKVFGESTVSKILDLVENASNRKSKSENFISKFAKYYTPIVVGISLLLAILPPVILNESFNTWIYRSLSFLVVSCPCALVVSIPLSFFGGIGASSKLGILIKGSNYLEALSKAEILVSDKTGTLTEGVFKVQKVVPEGISRDDLLKYASYAESLSNHPISLSLKESYGKKIDSKKVSNTKELSGMGVSAEIDGKKILVGNEKLLKENKIAFTKNDEVGTIAYVAINKKYSGYIVISDKIKSDSYNAIEKLRKNNIKRIVMLTGDKDNVSKNVCEELKLDEYYSELLPQNKVSKTEELMKEKSKDGKLIFVGDGINDAPVLALADIGVAMGGLGSDAAIEAADVVIMSDEVSKISTAIDVSKKTMRIVKQNIVFAIGIKIVVLLLSALGIASMWAAVFADVGVSIIAIVNALRILNVKKWRNN